MAAEQHTDHGQHGGHLASGPHAGHGDHAAQFRDRFWWSLALTVPVVAYSGMVQEWLGFTPPQFPGSDWVAPVLGTVVFLYGGWPFLQGGLAEARARQPGMMLLISLAILVGFGASAASALGLFDLEFWWELALLIVISTFISMFRKVPPNQALIIYGFGGTRIVQGGGALVVVGVVIAALVVPAFVRYRVTEGDKV